MIHSYSSIYALGHPAIKDLLTVPVIVEEKIDGSQFSFMRVGQDVYFRSKSAEVHPETTDKLFKNAVQYVLSVKDKLVENWVYRGEAVCSERQNVLKYNRPANGFIYLYDIETSPYNFLLPTDKYDSTHGGKEVIAAALGMEPCIRLFEGNLTDLDIINNLLSKESCLGGPKIEGVVIKPRDYQLFGRDKKVLMGKYVSEEFKEIHRREWRGSNPTKGDVIQVLASALTSEARWNKAIQHLREAGELESSPRDIGKLIREIQEDTKKEAEELVKDRLWKWAWPQLQRKVSAGFPEYYKKKLMENQFNDNKETTQESNTEND